MDRTAEVCVVGGGPAGATIADRLASLGHDVVLLERCEVPRPHVGEALTPRVAPLLELAGVDERVAVGVTSTSIWWDSAEPRAVMTRGTTVDRGKFDELLLEAARRRGAAVHAPAAAVAVRRTDDAWEVRASERAGRLVVRARFLVDATGRRRLLGGKRRWTSPRMIALHARWPSWRDDSVTARVVALRRGWLWAARLPDATVRAMAFLDPKALRHSDGPERVYMRMLEEGGLLRQLAADPGPVAACDASAYAEETTIDGASVKVGEAAFAIDPLSSAGVFTALQSAVAASASVHTLLTGRGDRRAALRYYAEHAAHAVEQHRRWTENSYGRHGLHRHEAFWRARSGDVVEPDAPVTTGSLRELWNRRVRLADDAFTAPTPCVVDDHVELRDALTSPGLERPVAFLDEVEVAPLLGQLETAPTLRDAVAAWMAGAVPETKCLAIVRWLHRHGLLAASPGPLAISREPGSRS